MVLRRCRTLLRNDAQAEDAMHDAFVAVLRAEDRLRDEAPAGLLLRVATNVCLNRLRTQRRRPEDADDALLSQIASTADPVEEKASARNLLARLFGADDPLAASTATLAVMHLCDRLTLEETAREAGLSVSGGREGGLWWSGVGKRLKRLRERLVALETTAEGVSDERA